MIRAQMNRQFEPRRPIRTPNSTGMDDYPMAPDITNLDVSFILVLNFR